MIMRGQRREKENEALLCRPVEETVPTLHTKKPIPLMVKRM